MSRLSQFSLASLFAVFSLSACTTKSAIPCTDDSQCTKVGAICQDKVCVGPGDALDLSGAADMSADGAGNGACSDNTGCTNASAPICDATSKSCRACAIGDCAGTRSQCGTRVPLVGQCLECTTGADCAASGQTCDATGTCVACQKHADCTSGICDAGACVKDADIAHVDNKQTPCTGADGTAAHAYCEIADVIALSTERSYVLVAGSSTAYKSIKVPTTRATSLSIIGPGLTASTKASIDVGESFPGFSVGTVAGAAQIVLDGFELSTLVGDPGTPISLTGSVPVFIRNVHVHATPDTVSVSCGACTTMTVEDSSFESGAQVVETAGASVTIVFRRNSFINNSAAQGINVSGGSVSILGNFFTANKGGILVLGASYLVENNVFMNNTNTAAQFDATSTGSFRNNTLVNNNDVNHYDGHGGVICGTATQILTSSILIGNSQISGSQISKCGLDGVVTGTDLATGAIQLSPDFVSAADAHLVANDPANEACCVDKSGQGPDTDADGAPRPKGKGYDYGAYEVE